MKCNAYLAISCLPPSLHNMPWASGAKGGSKQPQKQPQAVNPDPVLQPLLAPLDQLELKYRLCNLPLPLPQLQLQPLPLPQLLISSLHRNSCKNHWMLFPNPLERFLMRSHLAVTPTWIINQLLQLMLLTALRCLFWCHLSRLSRKGQQIISRRCQMMMCGAWQTRKSLVCSQCINYCLISNEYDSLKRCGLYKFCFTGL